MLTLFLQLISIIIITIILRWSLLKQAGCKVHSTWWKHSPSVVWENDDCKVLRDFTIVTDTAINHNRPDITLVRKTSNEVYLIDVTIPGESRISQKTVEKRTKNVDLKIEVSRLWRAKKAFVVPIIIGTLGSIPTDLSNYLETLNLPLYLIATFQCTVLFRTASILRQYLQI